MRLPNLNWPDDLYVDVMTPMGEFEMPAGDDDGIDGGGDGESRASSRGLNALMARLEPAVSRRLSTH